MLTFKRPILAASMLPPDVEHTDENILAAMEKLRYPVLATLKKDGIRALRLNGSLLSRTLKPIPNKSIRERSLVLPGGFDMELWSPSLTYDEVESIVMSREHPDSDKIQFHVLDWFHPIYHDLGYLSRWEFTDGVLFKLRGLRGVYSEIPTKCNSSSELMVFFNDCELNETEGICFRTPNSPYKQGRSTLKEQYLIKLCRYSRCEVTITDFEEQYENTNRTEYNAVGLVDRSSKQESLLPKNTLGAFICFHPAWGTIRVGTGVGLTDKLRKEIWSNKEKYKGKQITIKYKGFGIKNKPRSPIYVGFRTEGY